MKFLKVFIVIVAFFGMCIAGRFKLHVEQGIFLFMIVFFMWAFGIESHAERNLWAVRECKKGAEEIAAKTLCPVKHSREHIERYIINMQRQVLYGRFMIDAYMDMYEVYMSQSLTVRLVRFDEGLPSFESCTNIWLKR